MNQSMVSTLRIVFMGTPEFAVASLDALVHAGYKVVGVVTAPDKPAGRGMKITESAVKKYAVEKGITVLQPVKLKDPDFLTALANLHANIQVVVAFRMLPEIVWSMPQYGTINVHGSLLPNYRGAAPINWAVINGEHITGVTTFKLKQAIDTGDILMQQSMPIAENETATEVHDSMKLIGAVLLVKTVKALENGTLQSIPQIISEENKQAPKIFTKDCELNWNSGVKALYNRVRGLSSFPGALTQLEGKILKVYGSKPEPAEHKELIGTVITDGKTFLKYACADGYLHITELQIAGKKRMSIAEFLRGYKAGRP